MIVLSENYFSALSQLLATARANMPRLDESHGDYYDEDSILHCGICYAPKEYHVHRELNGHVLDFIAPIACLCTQKQIDEEQRRERIGRLREVCYCYGHSDMKECSFSKADRNQRAAETCRTFADNLPQKGLLICGPSGSGKSYLAACIVNRLTANGTPCLFTDAGTLADMMETAEQDVLKALDRYAVLVLDDLGSERENEYMTEKICKILDRRRSAKRPVIATTSRVQHIMDGETKQALQIRNRITEMCEPVLVPDRDEQVEWGE